MKVPKIAKAIENIDEDLIIATTTYLPKKEKSPVWLKLGAMAACLCIVSATVIFLIPKKEPTQPSVEPTQPTIEATQPNNKAIITYGNDGIPNVSTWGQVIKLTEEEMFSEVLEEGRAVFRGKVLALENFTADFGRDSDNIYGCIATISVLKVYKGDLKTGSIIRMRLPTPIGDDSISIWDTGAISGLRVNDEGIFIPRLYDEDDQIERNGKILKLKDLADCGISGFYNAFYSSYNETFNIYVALHYDSDLMDYEGLKDVKNLDDVEAYVVEMLEKYNSESGETENNETEK